MRERDYSNYPRGPPRLRRASGKPRTAGISPARALICRTNSGGKDPGAARARALFEPWRAFVEEALAPQAHDIAPHRERGGDLVIGTTFGGEENHLGAENLAIRQRILTRTVFQHRTFLLGETDREWAVSWHVW